MFKRYCSMLIFVFLLTTGSAFAFSSLDCLTVYDRMQLDPGNPDYIGYLIDVRTPQEWSGFPFTIGATSSIGTPGHPGYDGTNGAFLVGRVLNISYLLYNSAGTRVANDWFNWEFLNTYSFVTDEPFALLCHSGVRSYNAATDLEVLDASVGESWTIYNVLGGFEGKHVVSPPYCPTGDCDGWVEAWPGFLGGLPHIDNDSTGAYVHTPIPGAALLLASGLMASGIVRRRTKNKK